MMMASLPSSSHNAPPPPKRHSLNISIGPRPLHLVDGNVPSTAPLVPTASYSSSPLSDSRRVHGTRPHPRRQSSISYIPRDRIPDRDPNTRSPLTSPRNGLGRSNSLGPKATYGPGTRVGDRNSTGSIAEETPKERPPLTLAEKHAELLHFIAQKESKCLELRSQLAVNEAELLQLKRKWERIVNRGFERSNTSNVSTSPSPGNGAVLEGIKEGVQGVSRFIAAGLSISDPSATSSQPSPSPTPASSRPLRISHSTRESDSSASTYTTKSTRFSQCSSTSSLGEEPVTETPCKPPQDDTIQILMVRDTGATPTMSPNPEFMQQQQYQERREQEAQQSMRTSFEAGTEFFASSAVTSKMHRRKSRDVQAEGMVPLLDDLSSSRPSSPLDESARQKATRTKRASLNGSAFPPVSSIPGLGSFSVAATATTAPVSSWVGSVGKRWEELQRGSAFTKNQKRASVLLSDVSQSIVSALSSPPSASSPSTPSLYFSKGPSMKTSTSLLDDDDDNSGLMAASVMTPDFTSKPTLKPQQLQPTKAPQYGIPAASKTPSGGGTVASPLHKKLAQTQLQPRPKVQDEDDEWNW